MTISITMTVGRNVQLVRMGLQNLDAETVKIGKGQIYNQAQQVVKLMRPYPAERKNQKYIRTGLFGRSWQIEAAKSGGYSIRNTAQRKGRGYGKWVVGDSIGEQQARIHAGIGRWPVFREVVEACAAMLPAGVRDEIILYARKRITAQ